jgi:hypothetical protein
MSDLIRELREDYPAVDVTTVVFSRDFAGVGCCVIPQGRVLVIIAALEALEEALQFIADGYDNQDVNHVDFRVKAYQVATETLEALVTPAICESNQSLADVPNTSGDRESK